MLLLDSLPEDLRAEVVSVRAVTAEAMVFLFTAPFSLEDRPRRRTCCGS